MATTENIEAELPVVIGEPTEPKQHRAYIDSPTYVDEKGRRRPKLLAGGSKAFCEDAIKRYRKQNFAATQWPAKVVEVTEPGKDPEVSFE